MARNPKTIHTSDNTLTINANSNPGWVSASDGIVAWGSGSGQVEMEFSEDWPKGRQLVWRSIARLNTKLGSRHYTLYSDTIDKTGTLAEPTATIFVQIKYLNKPIFEKKEDLVLPRSGVSQSDLIIEKTNELWYDVLNDILCYGIGNVMRNEKQK